MSVNTKPDVLVESLGIARLIHDNDKAVYIIWSNNLCRFVSLEIYSAVLILHQIIIIQVI